MTVYIDSDFHCHLTNDGTMNKVETTAFNGKCKEFIEGYRYIPQGETWVRDDGMQFCGEAYFPWRSYSELEEIQNAVNRNTAEWEEKIAESDYVTDEDGNRYHREVGTDGEYRLVLIESYTGELYQ